jgi:hypothetical protein
VTLNSIMRSKSRAVFKTTAMFVLLLVSFGVNAQKKKNQKQKQILDRNIVGSVTSSRSDVCLRNPYQIVKLAATATDPMRDGLFYEWSVTSGKLSGSGRAVEWDLSQLAIGSYQATVRITSKKSGEFESSVDVRVVECHPIELVPPPCQIVVAVECPVETTFDRLTKFVAKVTGAPKDATLSYRWKVNWGKIISGEGTDTIEVQLKERWGENLIATVDVGGAADPSCITESSCKSKIRPD